MSKGSKVAIITGAGSGIGKAAVLAMLGDGFRVVLAGRRADMLEQVIGNFPGTRHSANAYHKISEIEQLEFKYIQDQKARAAAAASSQATDNV